MSIKQIGQFNKLSVLYSGISSKDFSEQESSYKVIIIDPSSSNALENALSDKTLKLMYDLLSFIIFFISKIVFEYLSDLCFLNWQV